MICDSLEESSKAKLNEMMKQIDDNLDDIKSEYEEYKISLIDNNRS